MKTTSRLSMVMGSLLALALGGCTGGVGAEQALLGRADLSTFPGSVTEVSVLRGNDVVATAPLGPDGSFRLDVPVGTGYRLQLHGANVSTLVFPRAAGAIDSRFDLRSAGPAFDLGTLRWVGDPTMRTYAFISSAAPGAPGAPADVECENGLDPSGAACIDDDADDASGTCEADDDTEVDDDAEVDDDGETADDAGADPDSVDCEDGIDPASGLECDGGPRANTDDGSEAGAPEEASETRDAVVADHNLPSVMGCSEDDEDDESDDD